MNFDQTPERSAHPALRPEEAGQSAPADYATRQKAVGDANFRDPVDWEDEDGAAPAPMVAS